MLGVVVNIPYQMTLKFLTTVMRECFVSHTWSHIILLASVETLHTYGCANCALKGNGTLDRQFRSATIEPVAIGAHLLMMENGRCPYCLCMRGIHSHLSPIHKFSISIVKQVS